MSILVIQGPHADSEEPPSQASLMASISESARSMGTSVSTRSCSSIAEISDCLNHSCLADTDMVLLDSGDLEGSDLKEHSAELCSAIDRLKSPYIEVHDDSAQALEPRLKLQHSPIVTVIINDNLKESYAIAMAIVANRLDRSSRQR